MTHIPPPLTPEAEAPLKPTSMRRVGFASIAGSIVEYYDFFIYGTAAALVFPVAFFPALGPVAGTLASFATLGVAFIFRPLGGLIFGYFGDRLGRKKTLASTLFIMGGATVVVGVMPTADQIGVAAPILIILMRILQGIAAGGEWAGAALFAAESAPKERRAFWGMSASLGGGIALVLSNSTFLVTGLTMSDDQFVSFGWRIPFLASMLLIGIGLYVRLNTGETPVFKSEQQRSGLSRAPFRESLKRQPREIVLATGMVLMTPTLIYIGTAYLTNYGRAVLKIPLNYVLLTGCVAGVSLTVGIVLAAVWSDRVGRRQVLIIASVCAVLWALVLFPILDLATETAFMIGVTVTMFISGLCCGPLGAYMSELFQTRYRYTAVGFSYNVANMIGGAIPPLVATAITAAYGSFVFGMCLAALCLISLVCVALLRETRGNDLHRQEPAPLA